jgi:uncharacterized protein (UPF0218 family)
MRDELAQPLGTVLPTLQMMQDSFDRNRNQKIITVGDLTTKTLFDADITPWLIVIDNKVERKAYLHLQPIFAKRTLAVQKVASGPGFIAAEAVQLIKDQLHRLGTPTLIIEVNGEEDLLALPVVVYAPLGSIVYYGQPPVSAWACGPLIQGIVEVVVTVEKQNEVKAILDRFSAS